MKILDFKKKKAEKEDRGVYVVINVSVLKELVEQVDAFYRETIWQGLAILALAIMNLFWYWIYVNG